MDSASDLWLCLAVAMVAWLYSSVGHAGASGYIALMTLSGMAPERIKPLALLLNILVATIAVLRPILPKLPGGVAWHLGD